VKRPWDKVFEFTANTALKFYVNCGLFGKETFEEALRPLFASVDIPLNITLQEYFEFSGIEMHWYVTNMTEFRLDDISYKTHPNWTVIDATYCSCALPILFSPCTVNNNLYIDGATFCAYPLNQCLAIADDSDEIFGITKSNPIESTIQRKKYSDIVDYLLDVLHKIMNYMHKYPDKSIKHEVSVEDSTFFSDNLWDFIKKQEVREDKIQIGVEAWKQFSQR
jgi:predicted acylesterase/phospholipase RssA